MARKWQAPDLRALSGKKCRLLRQHLGLDTKTLAGRADVGEKALQMFEAGRVMKPQAEFTSNIGKALRQLFVERAKETLAAYEPQIEADPDAGFFTREGAARRRVERYQSYSTTHAVTTDAIDEPTEEGEEE